MPGGTRSGGCPTRVTASRTLVVVRDRLGRHLLIGPIGTIAADDAGVAFRWKDYRIDGPGRWKTMRLHPHEFIRRFLMHVLPSGFHRIRHYGLFAGTVRARNIERVRQLLAAPERAPVEADADAETPSPAHRCPCCGGRMIIVETFEAARPAQPSSPSRIRIDTS